MSIRLATSSKNEGPFLLEWIAHHSVVGFDRILVGFNDCTDGSDDLLRALAAHDEIDIIDNIVESGVGPQASLQDKLSGSSFVNDSKWLAFFDIDEFLNIHFGDGKVGQYLQGFEDVDLVSLNWRSFGTGDQDEWRPHSTTENFLLAHDIESCDCALVKSITHNPVNFKRVTNHYCRDLIEDRPVRYAIGSDERIEYTPEKGKRMMRELGNFPVAKRSYKYAQLNHYATRTLDSFYLRRLRGRGWQQGPDIKIRHTYKYFMRQSKKSVHEDVSILKYSAARRIEESRLLALPGIKKLVDEINANYKLRVDAALRILENHFEQGLDLEELFQNPLELNL